MGMEAVPSANYLRIQGPHVDGRTKIPVQQGKNHQSRYIAYFIFYGPQIPNRKFRPFHKIGQKEPSEPGNIEGFYFKSKMSFPILYVKFMETQFPVQIKTTAFFGQKDFRTEVQTSFPLPKFSWLVRIGGRGGG
jgi:hypothetical protein